MSDRDEVYEEVMAMSEGELRAELAREGKTMEGVAAEMQQVFERAKAEAQMRKFIRAWLKSPAGEKRPSAWSLGFAVQQIAEQYLRDITPEPHK